MSTWRDVTILDKCVKKLKKAVKRGCSKPCCYHAYCRKTTIDRNCLTQLEHEQLLSTPKGYIFVGDAQRRAELKKCTKDNMKTRLGTGDMRPTVTSMPKQYTIASLCNYFNSLEIQCNSQAWRKEFLSTVMNSVLQIIVSDIKEVNTSETANIILKTLDSITNSKTTMSSPKDRLQEVQVYLSSALAPWLEKPTDNICADAGKTRGKTGTDAKSGTVGVGGGEKNGIGANGRKSGKGGKAGADGKRGKGDDSEIGGKAGANEKSGRNAEGGKGGKAGTRGKSGKSDADEKSGKDADGGKGGKYGADGVKGGKAGAGGKSGASADGGKDSKAVASGRSGKDVNGGKGGNAGADGKSGKGAYGGKGSKAGADGKSSTGADGEKDSKAVAGGRSGKGVNDGKGSKTGGDGKSGTGADGGKSGKDGKASADGKRGKGADSEIGGKAGANEKSGKSAGGKEGKAGTDEKSGRDTEGGKGGKAGARGKSGKSDADEKSGKDADGGKGGKYGADGGKGGKAGADGVKGGKAGAGGKSGTGSDGGKDSKAVAGGISGTVGVGTGAGGKSGTGSDGGKDSKAVAGGISGTVGVGTGAGGKSDAAGVGAGGTANNTDYETTHPDIHSRKEDEKTMKDQDGKQELDKTENNAKDDDRRLALEAEHEFQATLTEIVAECIRKHETRKTRTRPSKKCVTFTDKTTCPGINIKELRLRKQAELKVRTWLQKTTEDDDSLCSPRCSLDYGLNGNKSAPLCEKIRCFAFENDRSRTCPVIKPDNSCGVPKSEGKEGYLLRLDKQIQEMEKDCLLRNRQFLKIIKKGAY